LAGVQSELLPQGLQRHAITAVSLIACLMRSLRSLDVLVQTGLGLRKNACPDLLVLLDGGIGLGGVHFGPPTGESRAVGVLRRRSWSCRWAESCDGAVRIGDLTSSARHFRLASGCRWLVGSRIATEVH